MPRRARNSSTAVRQRRRRRSPRPPRSRRRRPGRRAARAPSRSLARVVGADAEQRELVDRRVGERLGVARPAGSGPARRSSSKRSKPSRTMLRSATRSVNASACRRVPSAASLRRAAERGRRPRPRGRRARARRGNPRMKIAPPPRPMPHSTRSPGDLLGADRVEAALEVVEAGAPHRRVRENGRSPSSSRTGDPGCAARCRSRSQLAAMPRAGSRELQRVGLACRCSRAAREVVEPHLVLEVVLVEQRALDDVEVPARGPRWRGSRLPASGAPDQLSEPQRLGQLEQLAPALGALEPVERRGELGPRLERALARRRSRARSRSAARPRAAAVVLGDEVVERGHHAVARPALLDRVGSCGFSPPRSRSSARPGHDAPLRVGLAELLRDPLGRVVEVAAAVGPADVVQDQHRQRRARPRARSRRAS